MHLVQRSGIRRRRYDLTVEARMDEVGGMSLVVALADACLPRVVAEMLFDVDAGLVEVRRGDGFDQRHGYKAGEDDICRVCNYAKAHIVHDLKGVVR